MAFSTQVSFTPIYTPLRAPTLVIFHDAVTQQSYNAKFSRNSDTCRAPADFPARVTAHHTGTAGEPRTTILVKFAPEVMAREATL